ncbi:MAG: choice-of-anchor B family protein [Lewinellaceae bacterium]|nr:choice-of-anchor B family protein [Lewinellaceae bacterium]
MSLKISVLIAPFLLLTTLLPAQNAMNMTRLSAWDDDSLPVASPGNLNLQYSGCWGITVGSTEIAVLGGAAHLLFFDVTNPETPQLIGKFAGSATTVWREIKSYKNRVYAVSDNTSEGLMIFDCSQAPDTIIRTYWSNVLFNKAHTITLDTVSGRIYLNGSNEANQGLLILDVSQNPDQPVLLANQNNLPGGYIHDSYVRNDTVYASSGYNGYFVYDCTDPQNIVTLASVATGGYNHNSWLTADGRYAFYTEEVPQGRPIRVVDLQNLANNEIEVVYSFLDGLLPGGDTLAIPHNVYIADNLLFDSQYEDGLLVYDISEPTQPVLIAWYDTHPENTTYNKYYGCWGNYPWFASGNIVAGDMQNGLLVLKIGSTGTAFKEHPRQRFQVSPNPASGFLNIQWNGNSSDWNWKIMDQRGRTVQEGSAQNQIALSDIPNGLYYLQIVDQHGNWGTEKVVVIR